MRTGFPAMLLAALAIAGGAPALAQTQAELAYCEQLAAYHDRYSMMTVGAFNPGGVDRAVGLVRCRKGDVAAGTEQLKRAIRLIGFEPPAPAPQN